MLAQKRTRLSPEERKDEIVTAGVTLAELQGLNNFSSPDLARVCGCGHPLIYHHFGNMAFLRQEIMRKAIAVENLNVLAQGLVNKDPVALSAPESLKRKALKNI